MAYEQCILAFFGGIGVPELVVIGVLGVLIFGNRLPEVGRSVGKGIIEFKKGLKGINNDIEEASSKDSNNDAKPSGG